MHPVLPPVIFASCPPILFLIPSALSPLPLFHEVIIPCIIVTFSSSISFKGNGYMSPFTPTVQHFSHPTLHTLRLIFLPLALQISRIHLHILCLFPPLLTRSPLLDASLNPLPSVRSLVTIALST